MSSKDMDKIVDQLQNMLPVLTANSCASIYAALTSYGPVTHKDLERSISGNMRIAVEVLSTGNVPRSSDLQQAAVVSVERFSVGVDVEELILAFRISFRDIHEAFMELAAGTLSVEELTQGARSLWDASDAFVGRAVSTYSQLRLDDALAHADRRKRTLRNLLSGMGVSREELASIGVSIDRKYAVIRSPHIDKELREIISRTGSSPDAPAQIIELDDSEVGIVPVSPEIPETHLVCIGSFVALSRLSESDVQARRALQVARKIKKGGLHSVDSLGWRMALLGAEDVSQRYRDKFIEPVLDCGEFGADLLQTVAAWIAQGRSYVKTAEVEKLHVNSVRHRVSRFAELTGYSDESADDFIGLVWALETSFR